MTTWFFDPDTFQVREHGTEKIICRLDDTTRESRANGIKIAHVNELLEALEVLWKISDDNYDVQLALSRIAARVNRESEHT